MFQQIKELVVSLSVKVRQLRLSMQLLLVQVLVADGAQAVAIGRNSRTIANNSVAIGNETRVHSTNGFALGNNARAGYR